MGEKKEGVEESVKNLHIATCKCIRITYHDDPDGVDVFRAWHQATEEYNSESLFTKAFLFSFLDFCNQLCLHILQLTNPPCPPAYYRAVLVDWCRKDDEIGKGSEEEGLIEAERHTQVSLSMVIESYTSRGRYL